MPKPFPQTTDLHVEVLDSVDALRAVAEDWDDLWQRSDVTMPTVCAEPAALWIETFAPASRVHILTVRQDKRLVGALPLVERKLGRVVPVGDLALNPWSANGELLLDGKSNVALVIERIAKAVCSVPWPLLWFDMVPCQAESWMNLAKTLTSYGAQVDVRPRFEIGRASLQQPFDVYMAERSKNLRRSVRKDLKQLECEGRVEFRLLDNLQPDEVEEALRRAFTLEDSGWKGLGGTSVLRSDGVFQFYLRQSQYFARCGVLRMAFLECAGRPIAFELGWLGKGVYHSLKVGYDEDYRRFGPGHLLRCRLIEAGCSDPRLRFVDFQGPINQALHQWATETYMIGRLSVCPPRISSEALWAGVMAARSLSHTFRHAAAWLS